MYFEKIMYGLLHNIHVLFLFPINVNALQYIQLNDLKLNLATQNVHINLKLLVSLAYYGPILLTVVLKPAV